jgi:hypothetical protein
MTKRVEDKQQRDDSGSVVSGGGLHQRGKTEPPRRNREPGAAGQQGDFIPSSPTQTGHREHEPAPEPKRRRP